MSQRRTLRAPPLHQRRLAFKAEGLPLPLGPPPARTDLAVSVSKFKQHSPVLASRAPLAAAHRFRSVIGKRLRLQRVVVLGSPAPTLLPSWRSYIGTDRASPFSLPPSQHTAE